MNDVHDLILEELGLMPLWVRHELLDAATEPPPARAQQTATAQATPPQAVQATQASVPAAQAMASDSQPDDLPPLDAYSIDEAGPDDNEPATRRPRPAIPIAEQAARPAAAPVPANDDDLERQRRAAAIAAMNWDELQTAIAGCTACGLCKTRSKTVFGVGNPKSDWLVVGEAPGADEDRQGEPFVGQAGKLLDAMLASVDRSRQENAFILNTLKCRPPQNRNPNPDELALCAPFLHRQIELIGPKVIFAVGRFAVQTLLGRDASIASLRNQLHDYRGTPVVVSYHPAYLLRNPPDKVKAWQDLLLARKTVTRAG